METPSSTLRAFTQPRNLHGARKLCCSRCVLRLRTMVWSSDCVCPTRLHVLMQSALPFGDGILTLSASVCIAQASVCWPGACDLSHKDAAVRALKRAPAQTRTRSSCRCTRLPLAPAVRCSEHSATSTSLTSTGHSTGERCSVQPESSHGAPPCAASLVVAKCMGLRICKTQGVVVC